MKKSALFASIIMITLPLTFTSCGGTGGTSTDTGYSTITFTRDLMAPSALKEFTVGTLINTPPNSDCLAVSYSGNWDSTDYTAFVIVSATGYEKLTLIIKDLLLADGTTTVTGHTLDSTNVIAKYIKINSSGTGSNIHETQVSGSVTVNITKTENTAPEPKANGESHTYYTTTIEFQAGGNLEIGTGANIITIANGGGDKIVAMHYPQAEPDMTE